ncbi:MAG: hypothetical protein ACLP8S_15085 [Solirubrobacteraceae bacterium]
MRRAARHSWVVWYRRLVTVTVFATSVVAIASQRAHESNGSFGVQMSHVAAVATITCMPLCFPRLTLRLLGMTLTLSLLGAGAAARPTRRR